jgi:predicted ATP-grasp superfamily ATP-dependent carboligase
VRQRLKRGRNNGYVGHETLMEDVEPYLVELIKKLAKMRTPITTSQGLELANSLIKGQLLKKNGEMEFKVQPWL